MTPTASTGDLTQAYEALRAQAVGQTPTVTPRGLALVRILTEMALGSHRRGAA